MNKKRRLIVPGAAALLLAAAWPFGADGLSEGGYPPLSGLRPDDTPDGAHTGPCAPGR